MTHFLHYRSGALYGIRYRFDAAGDGIPHHEHGSELAHNIIVLAGRVRLEVNGEPDRELPTGSINDFSWAKRHAVIALEPNSEVLHMMLNGMPEGYDTLPPSELRGQLSFQTGLH